MEAMDIDLNLEPLDSLHTEMMQLGLDASDNRIEERLMRIKAVTSRLRYRQRWRQGRNSPRSASISGETSSTNAQINSEELGAVSQQRTFQPRTCRRSTYLVAKALGIDENEQKKFSNTRGSFFDCNVCLGMPKDPILTCCGHLFCWPCFYQLPYVHSGIKECPVCSGEVADVSITPVYGHGHESQSHRLKLKQAGFKLPPRPPARRIEHRKW